LVNHPATHQISCSTVPVIAEIAGPTFFRARSSGTIIFLAHLQLRHLPIQFESLIEHLTNLSTALDVLSDHAIDQKISFATSSRPFSPALRPHPKDLTGKTFYHDGPSYSNNAIAKIGILPVIPLIHRGSSEVVEHHYLWRLPRQMATATSWKEFKPHWEYQKTQKRCV
jgi:hypothetical protein